MSDYLTAGLSVFLADVSVLRDDVSDPIVVVVVSGALCNGAALESAEVPEAPSVVELSVHEAMIEVIAMIARNFFI